MDNLLESYTGGGLARAILSLGVRVKVSGVLVHYGADSVYQSGITNALLVLPALLLRDQHRLNWDVTFPARFRPAVAFPKPQPFT